MILLHSISQIPSTHFNSIYELLSLFSPIDQQGSGTATAGVFTYFFWVLLQPFRGNPEYRDVADLPYNATCLNNIDTHSTNMKTISKYFMCKRYTLTDYLLKCSQLMYFLLTFCFCILHGTVIH